MALFLLALRVGVGMHVCQSQLPDHARARYTAGVAAFEALLRYDVLPWERHNKEQRLGE